MVNMNKLDWNDKDIAKQVIIYYHLLSLSYYYIIIF